MTNKTIASQGCDFGDDSHATVPQNAQNSLSLSSTNVVIASGKNAPQVAGLVITEAD